MPIVNYVREHTRFIQYASDEHVPANERLLWYALMHIMNQRAQGNVWPDEFIRINNDLLLSYCAMRYDTMATARNGLKQRGLIDYEPGKKNIKSPAYRMIYFYPEFVPSDSEEDGIRYPKISDNIGGKPCYNIGGNIRYNIGGNIPNNNINYTKTDIQEEEDNSIARAREETRQAFSRCFGREISEYGEEQIANRAVLMCEFEPGVITKAIQLAALKMWESPVDYVLNLFHDWNICGIRTPDDVDEYLFLRDVSRGKKPGLDAQEGQRALEQFKNKLKAERSQRHGQEGHQDGL